MAKFCGDGGSAIQSCRCDEDRAYAICKDDKIYRFTFSKDVAQHILSLTDGYEIRTFDVRIGRRLKSGEQGNGLYGILSSKTNKLLRISCIKDVAEFLTQDDSRYIAECWIK